MTAQGEEGVFSKAVLELAKLYGWKVYKRRWNPRGRPDVPGWPDLVMLRRGRLVILELKREKGGTISPEQQEWLDEWGTVAITAPPGQIRVAVVKPSDLQTIAAWLA